MGALQNLTFTVSLLDRMSGPARNMMTTMDKVTGRIQGGFNKIGYGAAGLAGSAYSLDAILQPAKDMQTSLGEVKSLLLGTADGGKQVLENLNSTALQFTTQFGGSAAEFVSSAYQIQSAISGLAGNELPAFTNASAILAKATKADMGVITNYVGTMYQVFQDQADAMGKADWINKMAGQTATAVNIFKVEGQDMAEAFANLGANAKLSGIAMDEQMAILGTLTSSMRGGAEAGTAYRSFLDKVVKSQKDLGLNFLDSQNHMLPMVDILTKIKAKYGDLTDMTQKSIVSKAFGESPEAMGVIMRLIGNIDGLKTSIDQVGDKSGWQSAIDMANAMTQPWDRASASVENLRIVLGQKMLVVLEPVYNKITAVSQTLLRWSELFPNITRYVGYAAFAIIGITAALSLLSIIVGLGMVSTIGFGLAWSAIGLILAPLTPLITALRMAWAVMKMEMLAGSGVFAVLRVGLVAFATQLWTNIAAIWAWNVALFSNPITLWILGIAAVIGLVAAAVIYWDTWTQEVINFTATWLEFIGVFALVDKIIAGIEILKNGWQSFKQWLSGLHPFDVIGQGIDWLIEKINMIPGIHIDTGKAAMQQPALSNLHAPAQSPILTQLSTPSALTGTQTGVPTLSALAEQPKWLQQPAPGLVADGFAPPQPVAPPAALNQPVNVPRGGLMSQINNADNSKTVSVGGITVNNYGQPVTGQLLADQIAMAAG